MRLWDVLTSIFGNNGKPTARGSDTSPPESPSTKTDSLASFRRSSKMLKFEDLQDEALRDALKEWKAKAG